MISSKKHACRGSLHLTHFCRPSVLSTYLPNSVTAITRTEVIFQEHLARLMICDPSSAMLTSTGAHIPDFPVKKWGFRLTYPDLFQDLWPTPGGMAPTSMSSALTTLPRCMASQIS